MTPAVFICGTAGTGKATLAKALLRLMLVEGVPSLPGLLVLDASKPAAELAAILKTQLQHRD